MNGGVKTALLASCISLAGCATTTQEVKVRAIPDPAAALSRGGDLTALARGELLIGNVGLALEGFRKAQRAYPADAAPLAGIGDCYAAMGRFDIAQSNYEAALALAPNDRRLLLALADIFEHEGQPLKAMAARADADRASQAIPSAAVAMAAGARVATALTAPAAVERPQRAGPTKTVAAATTHAEPIAPAPAPQPIAHVAPAVPIAAPVIAKADPLVPSKSVPASKPAETLASQLAEQAEIPMHVSAGSITVELPPARPVTHVEARVSAPALPPIEEPRATAPPLPPTAVAREAAPPLAPTLETRVLASSVTVALPPARPVAPKRPAPVDEQPTAIVQATAPRLERLTRGEVALVTTEKPLWRAQGDSRMASGTGVRWAALPRSPDTRPNVQVLNAARTQGIAGSARTVLLNRGWRRIDVGDAPATRAKSVVLYSRNRAKLGKSLAAQFGVASRMVERDGLVLLLGRDAVDRVSGQRKS